MKKIMNVDETIQTINNLQDRIAAEYENRESIKKNISILISLPALKSIQNRLEEIKKLLKISQYNLAFIGQIGVGKTTAICHLFNLLREEEKREPAKKSGKPQIKKVVRELLSTGSGRTTIGEVIIKASPSPVTFIEIEPYSNEVIIKASPSPVTFIEIEPYSNEEIVEFIREFCDYVWQKAHPNADLEVDDLPAEVRRAIENVVNLKLSSAAGSKDSAVDFAEKFTDESTFVKAVMERANLSQRTEKRIEFNPRSNGVNADEEKLWLEKTFSDLNLAKLESFSIPRKILIYTSPKLIDFSKYSRFRSIIDTRGLDGIKDRADLESYIRDKDDTICIFTEYFNSAPTNVAELIRRYLTPESKQKHIDTKVALLVLPHKGEPENVLGNDGKVNSREEGIELRKKQIEEALAGQKIKFIEENILFHDAFQYYLPDGRRDPDCEQQDIDEETERVLSDIQKVIDRREAAFGREVEDIANLFQKIKNGQELNAEDKKLIEDLKKTIKECGKLGALRAYFISRYIQELKTYHVMQFRAINNRFGTYKLRNADIYFDSKRITENIVRENLSERKSRIMGEIQLAKEHASKESGLSEHLQVLEEDIDRYYEEIIIELGQKIFDILKEEKLAPQDLDNPFWQGVQQRWGDGLGYRNDVLEMYKKQIVDIETFLDRQIRNLWEEKMMARIMPFFGNEESD